MAVKKSTGKKGTTGAAKKAGAKAGATKTTAKKSVKTGTAAKANTPKAAAKKSAGAKAGAGAAKKKAAVKINERQGAILSKVRGAGAGGYFADKGEQRTLDALRQRKLLTRGTKDKARGAYPYTVSKAGEKHLGPVGGGTNTGGMA